MTPTLIGDYPYTQRLLTGLDSFDEALSTRNHQRGMPLRTVYEIYGYPSAGKSSLSYYLLGRLRPEGEIVVCDLEGLDREYILSSAAQAGYDGAIRIVEATLKKKDRPHSDMMKEAVDSLARPEVNGAVIDSVGATIPTVEAAGEPEEAFMGKRAQLIGRIATRAVQRLRLVPEPKVVFFINHVHSIIGGRGHDTAGGVRLKFMAAQRIMLHHSEVITDSNKDPLAFVSAGTIEKLRFGSRGRKFKVAILPGIGVSPELTALIDAVDLGLASREATVKVGGQSVGYLSKLVTGLYDGHTEKFDPFIEAIKDYRRKQMGVLSVEEELGDEEENDD